MASRTPVNGVGYDKSLLADAPEITKADKQEGYDADLLEAGGRATATPRPGTVPPGGTRSPALIPPSNKYTGGSDESSGVRKGGLPLMTQTGSKPRRSKKMFIAIAAVVFLIIIGVAVGVGVGVTKGRGNNNNNATNGTEPSTTKPDGSTSSSTDPGKPEEGVSTPSETSTNVGGDVASTPVPFFVPTTSSDGQAGSKKYMSFSFTLT